MSRPSICCDVWCNLGSDTRNSWVWSNTIQTITDLLMQAAILSYITMEGCFFNQRGKFYLFWWVKTCHVRNPLRFCSRIPILCFDGSSQLCVILFMDILNSHRSTNCPHGHQNVLLSRLSQQHVCSICSVPPRIHWRSTPSIRVIARDNIGYYAIITGKQIFRQIFSYGSDEPNQPPSCTPASKL